MYHRPAGADLHHEMVKDFTGKMILQKKSSILSKPVMQCVDYIYTHIKERITITTLAEYTDLSESYLSRVFKQNLGISISDYIREKRLKRQLICCGILTNRSSTSQTIFLSPHRVISFRFLKTIPD